MKTNRYESSRFRIVHTKDFLGAGPAWWGLAIASACAFVWIIGWMLTCPAAAA